MVKTLVNGFTGEKVVCRLAARVEQDDIDAGYCWVESPDTLMDEDGSKGLLKETYAEIHRLEPVPEGAQFGDVERVAAIDPFKFFGV